MGARAGRAFVLRPTRPHYLRAPVDLTAVIINATTVSATTGIPTPDVTGPDANVFDVVTVAAVGDVPASIADVMPRPAAVAATASVPAVSPWVILEPASVDAFSGVPAPGVVAYINPAPVAAVASVEAPDVRGDNVVITPTTVDTYADLYQPSIPIAVQTVVAVADVPFADNGQPPGVATDFTATVADEYSISLSWTIPTDVDFDHVLILRTDGLPYADPGDQLLDPSVSVVSVDSNNGTLATAVAVDSGDFHDMVSTAGRPNTGTRATPGAWYSYTPETSGTVTVSTVGSGPGFDTYLYLLADDGTTVIAEDDDTGEDHGGEHLTSWLTASVTGGTTYYVLAQGHAAIDLGDLYVNVVGPAPAGGPATGGTTIDSGLAPNTTYYYAIYTYDWAGNVNSTQVTAFATTAGTVSDAPFEITVEMPVGSFSILAGTPVEPVGSDPIVYYGVPITTYLSMPAGASWNVNLLEPPPPRPGSTTAPPVSFDPAIVRTPTDMRVELWDYTNTEKVIDLDYSADRTFLDEYNGVGSGGLRVPSTHADALELKRDRVVRYYYKDIPDPVFASILETRKTAVVAEAGDAWTEVSGRGLLSWLEDAVVLPFVYDKTKLPTGYKILADGSKEEIQSNIMVNAPDVRAFNFGSRDAFEHDMFDDTGPGSGGSDPALDAVWESVQHVLWSNRSDYMKGNPVKWPDPVAAWISIRNPQTDAPDGEKLWFRGSFLLMAETTLEFHMTANDYCDWYIDGEWMVKTVNWRGEDAPHAWSIRTRTLQPGVHYIQAALQNAYLPAVKYNPSSIIFTSYIDGNRAAPFYHTGANNWQVTRTPQTFDIVRATHGPGWHRPLGISQGAKPPMNVRAYFPTDWPDHTAKWIWGSDPTETITEDEVCWFRAKIWIPADGTYRWFSTGDDSYMVWFDGIEIASLNYDVTAASGWQRTDEVDLDLDQGWHTVSMRGQNRNTAWLTKKLYSFSNPAAVLGTLMTLDSNLKPLAPVPYAATSNAAPPGDAEAGWWANWSGPAWKAGDVLLTLVEEARARGVTRLQNITMDFTAELDSMGMPWTTRVSRTWDVGTNLLQVAFDLCELGVDIWMTPDNVLHCAERRGSDDPTFSVVYGSNVTGYDTNETFTGASVAYTRTRTGWFTLNNDVSELILGGKREAGISLANTDSEDQSIGLSHRAIGAVVMANMVATAQAIVPIEGSIPYVDAKISDIIYVLSPSGQQRMGRLLSISVTENDAGTTTWVPEIEIWQSPFGDGIDPNKPRDPVDPNNPYDSSIWVPAAEDWTRFIPDGAGTDYPRAVTMPGTGTSGGAADVHAGAPSPSPSGRTAPPRNSAQAARIPANAANNATPPNAERVAIQPTPPLTTAGYHLWVNTTGVT